MCGRYNVVSDAAALRAAYSMLEALEDEIGEQLTANYNCAPTDSLPIIRQRPGHDGAVLETAHWGLVPFWARDRKSAARMINARAESLGERRAYRDSAERRRCLVPATGWYEWRKEGSVRQPCVFESEGVMTFAGLWAWNRPLGLVSYTIVTVAANSVVEPWHDRMPAMLGEHELADWLDPDATLSDVMPLLRPYGGNDLSARRVSRRVGDVRQNDPELLRVDAEDGGRGPRTLPL